MLGKMKSEIPTAMPSALQNAQGCYAEHAQEQAEK